MPIKPQPGEGESDFMSRCISQEVEAGAEQDQAVAICSTAWREKTIKQAPEPEEDETRDEFMSRCMDEIGDEGECELAWDERKAVGMVHKTHAGTVHGMEFILSDDTADRLGDIIQVDGWQLDNFKRNPVALFNHRSDFLIGKWRNLRIAGNELRGHLQLAPEGTSPRIDEIRKLVDAGILKAVSVGFKPLKYEPLSKDDPFAGIRFLQQDLVETSLVSVPANPNALAVAKSLGTSAGTMALVFAEHGKRDARHRRQSSNGKHAETSRYRKTKPMTLAQQIIESQGRISVLSDALKAHLDEQDNDNVSNDDIEKTNELNAKLKHERKRYEALVESEKNLGGKTAAENGDGDVHEIRMPTRRIESASTRVYPEVSRDKKYQPGDYYWKALVCLVKMQGDRYRKKTQLDVIRDTVGENDKVRMVFESIVGKAASAPALTTTVGWAAELVRTEHAAFLELLQPAAVATRLFAKGLTFTFGTNGIISIPMRSPTPTIAGSFVGEGAPIPVRQGAFQAIQLLPKKMAVISVFSREISEHSDPAIEGLLRTGIVEDTAVAIDSVLLDANPATAVRPAGLRNGVATLTPTAGADFAAVVADVKQAVAALQVSTLGNIRMPVWLMPPALVLALRLTVAPNGALVFAEEINRGQFLGYPIIESPNVTAETMYLIDAADLMSSTGEPRFDVSDSATVHMEDTAPAAIGSTGTPPVVAAPVRSFWQTDTLGIRMIMPMNWAQRRAGMVVYITGVTWK